MDPISGFAKNGDTQVIFALYLKSIGDEYAQADIKYHGNLIRHRHACIRKLRRQ
jgi:hypothetical protein